MILSTLSAERGSKNLFPPVSFNPKTTKYFGKYLTDNYKRTLKAGRLDWNLGHEKRHCGEFLGFSFIFEYL